MYNTSMNLINKDKQMKEKEFKYVDTAFIPRKPRKKKSRNAKAYVIREIDGKDVYIDLK